MVKHFNESGNFVILTLIMGGRNKTFLPYTFRLQHIATEINTLTHLDYKERFKVMTEVQRKRLVNSTYQEFYKKIKIMPDHLVIINKVAKRLELTIFEVNRYLDPSLRNKTNKPRRINSGGNLAS